MILGIAGHIGSGKDTVAAHLIRAHGFVRRGFADALKEEVAAKFRTTLAAYLVERGCGPDLDAAIHDALWRHRTPVTRALLQEFGSEVRRAEDPHYWVNAWAAWVDAQPAEARIVTPDVRFRNEAEAILVRGGALLHVERPGHDGDAHQSEHDLDGWTKWAASFRNDGTIADLEAQAEAWFLGYLTPPPRVLARFDIIEQPMSPAERAWLADALSTLACELGKGEHHHCGAHEILTPPHRERGTPCAH